jgi:hypothetical protein
LSGLSGFQNIHRNQLTDFPKISHKGLFSRCFGITPVRWRTAALLVRPLLELRGGRTRAEDAIRAVRGRGVAIALGAVLLYLAVPA